jgi:unsaturated rhamnogalacturonyl hydrolase
MKKRTLIASFCLAVIGNAFAQNNQVIFRPAEIKKNIIRVTQWQLNNPKHGPTDWTNGAFYAGVVAGYKTTGSKMILDSLMAMGERTRWEPGKRYDHADDIAISQTYIDLYRIKKDRRMIQPTIDTVEKVKTVPGNEVKRHGITWWWCDALFMAPPTLVKLGVTLKDPSYFKMNDSLFKQTYDLLYNKEADLFARDASYLINDKGEGKREKNNQLVFWSRGNGWVMGGLVKVLFTRRWLRRLLLFSRKTGSGAPACLILNHFPAVKEAGRDFIAMHLPGELIKGFCQRQNTCL